MADQPKKVTVKRRTYKDKEYLVTVAGKVYDPATREEQDELRWDDDAQEFIELSKYGLDEENFEDAEDYNQYLKNLDWEIDEEPKENGFRNIYADNGDIVSFIKETDIFEDDVIIDLMSMGYPIRDMKVTHPYTNEQSAFNPEDKSKVTKRTPRSFAMGQDIVDITIQVFVGQYPAKEESKPNVLFYPVFWSGQITAVDVETKDWSDETELDLTEPIGYIGVNVGENLDAGDPDLYPRYKEILRELLYEDLTYDERESIEVLQHPAKIYNDINKTFISTLGFDLPKIKMTWPEHIWKEPLDKPAAVAAAVVTPVVQEKKAVATPVVQEKKVEAVATKEVIKDELEVHPKFGLVKKITPFRPSGTPKEKKEQTKKEMKTLKPVLQQLLDEVGEMETELVRLEGIIGSYNRRFNELSTEVQRIKKTETPATRSGDEKPLKAEMYKIKEELKPYEIQFDELEHKYQAAVIISSTEEFKFDELEKLYATFKEGKGIYKIKEGGALKGLDPNKKTDILKYSDPKKAISNAIKYLKNNIVFGLSTKKTKKYMVQNPDGKWIHFGEMGYEDFTKHQDDKRRQNYLKRTANMKGNWKDDKYSANNLARNILW